MTAVRATLLAKELESLRQLTRGAMKKRISVKHGEKLVRCGFAKIRAGALTVTTMGHAKLAFEIIGARLLTRGLIERKAGGFALTARGRIALTKLG